MKIIYIVLSCDKHKNTRQKWQQETWLKSVDEMNYIYLDKPVGEEVYNNAPLKYIEFFKRMAFEDNYDWFFFCDDDTFVDTDKLYTFLDLSLQKVPLMIGFKGGTFEIHNLKITWCSGGAGIAMNRELVKKIQAHLCNTPAPLVTHETDISLAIWARMSTETLTIIDSKRFSPFNPQDAAKENMKDCITYHYCTEQDFYNLYNK